MKHVYEISFCRETIMICSSLEKAKEAVKMLLNKEEFRGWKEKDFYIYPVNMDTYNGCSLS